MRIGILIASAVLVIGGASACTAGSYADENTEYCSMSQFVEKGGSPGGGSRSGSSSGSRSSSGSTRSGSTRGTAPKSVKPKSKTGGHGPVVVIEGDESAVDSGSACW